MVSGVIVEKFVNMLEQNCVGMSTESCESKDSSRETCRSSILVLKNLKKAMHDQVKRYCPWWMARWLVSFH